MSKDRDHTKGFGEIRSISTMKEKDTDLKTWTVTSGEKNLKSILFSENEREIELKQETMAVHNKMNTIFCVIMTNTKASEKTK